MTEEEKAAREIEVEEWLKRTCHPDMIITQQTVVDIMDMVRIARDT